MAQEQKRRSEAGAGRRPCSEPISRPSEPLLEDRPEQPAAQDKMLKDSVTRRRVFAKNLDRLLTVIGLSRKDAADELGIPYSLVRRFVTLGISRRDERNAEYLEKIIRYFGLEEVEMLWSEDLIYRLLASGQGRGFVEAFRPRLEEQRQKWLAILAEVDRDLLRLVNGALGYYSGVQDPGPIDEHLANVRTILMSSKAVIFRQLIEDYLRLATERPMKSLRDTEEA